MFRKIVGVKPQRFSKPLRFLSEFIYLNVYSSLYYFMHVPKYLRRPPQHLMSF